MYGRPRLLRTILLAFVLPLALLGSATAWVLANAPRLSARPPIVVDGAHFEAQGVSGEMAMFGAFGLIVVAIFGIIAVVDARTELTRRVSIGTVNGWAAMQGVMMVQSVQGAIAGTHHGGPRLTAHAIVAFLAAMWLTGLFAGKDPRRPTTLPVDPSLPRLGVPDDRRVAWYARVHPSRAALVGMLALLAVAGLVGWWWWSSVGWWGLALPAMWLHRFLGDLAWEVRVNAIGLTARSWLARRPAIVVPADEILRVDADGPVRNTWFSGPGLVTELDGTITLGLGGSGSIVILATGQRRYVLTVPRAEEAARTLNTMADGARLGAA